MDGYKGRMLSEVTPLPGFETMEIIEATTKRDRDYILGSYFVAQPPKVTEHEIESVLGTIEAEPINGAAGYVSALDKRSAVIMEMIREQINDIDQFIDPLMEHVFLNREEEENVRLSKKLEPLRQNIGRTNKLRVFTS